MWDKRKEASMGVYAKYQLGSSSRFDTTPACGKYRTSIASRGKNNLPR